MATISREAASAVVGQIREANGGISEEDKAVTPPAVLRALGNVRNKLGAATKILAKSIYSKDIRLLYELIQNAEDNTYTRAEAAGVDRYVSFSLYPDKIVIESNEDGFLEADVEAICSTGKSKKTNTQGYIGEKGIGFKSVFKVAKKVHIQSEPFSFSFKSEKDSPDEGIGMVTPLDEDYDDLPGRVQTRITLTLIDSSSFSKLAEELTKLSDALLLFLSKLDALHINIYPHNGSGIETEYSISRDLNRYHATVINNVTHTLETVAKTTTVNEKLTLDKRSYYVTRNLVEGLPFHEARKNTNETTVVLAFPIKNGKPDLEILNDVFAFLPLDRVGFKFLIQSDFITIGNREKVDDNPRNAALRDRVGETFRAAVHHFCTHHVLQYEWIKYLPEETSIADPFWEELRPRINSLLKTTHCLQSWSGTSLHLPPKLYHLPEFAMDQYDEPLFPDLVEEVYLSAKYTFSDKIVSIGVHKMHFDLMIKIIKADLGSENSRMKAVKIDENWHTKVSELLLRAFNQERHKEARKNIMLLELIPLQSHSRDWVSTKTATVFLPYTDSSQTIPVPTDLGLSLVRSDAVLNTTRKDFLVKLGVRLADPMNIILLITSRYTRPSSCTLVDNISHLRYLYWNLPPEVLAIDEKIFLMDQDEKPVHRITDIKEHIYFKDGDDDYGPQRLFESGPLEKPTAPGLSVHFINTKYLDAVPADASHNGRSWKDWLQRFTGVHSYPQLKDPKDPKGFKISEEFKYVIANRPEKIVGLLEKYWQFYDPEMSSAVVKEIRSCLVPSTAGPRIQLDRTFLPLPKWTAIVERFRIVNFPFLTMATDLIDENIKDWQFLRRFAVKVGGGVGELNFYVECLIRIADQNQDSCDTKALDALFEIYGAIQQNCSSAANTEYLCELFKNHKIIYVPSNTVQDAEWVNSDACVWHGPEWLETKRRLSGISKFDDCKHLFQMILKMGDAGWKHYLEDLKLLKEQSRCDSRRVADIYQRLWREFEHNSHWETLKTSFEELGLVFVPLNKTWNSPSSCVWADDQVRIPYKAPIRTPYAHLEGFFCRLLAVPTPNLEMHVQALEELARSQPAPDATELKRMIRRISSMNPSVDDVTTLMRSDIFAVKTSSGTETLTNAAAEFAIVDRPAYGSAFIGKINLLDYSIEEVCACKSLFNAMDLKRRYLSEMVEEKTNVQGGSRNSELSKNFQMKAYALFRCAVHYHSPKSGDGDKALYYQLLQSSIYCSDGIFKSISVVQYGQTATAENSRANFHLEEDGDELRLYVPKDEISQEECFFRQLPRRLMTYFAVSDPTAETLMTGIIGCRSLVAVDSILADAGIIEIKGVERSQDAVSKNHQNLHEYEKSEGDMVGNTSRQISQSGTFTPVSTASTSSATDYPRAHRLDSSSYNYTPIIRLPSPPEEYERSSMENAIPEATYANLIDQVISSAARMTIPVKGSDFIDYLQQGNSLGATSVASILTSTRLIGAAGELLAYEIMLKLGLDGFTEDNWKSQIRNEVSVHNKYRHLKAWPEPETADITYFDGNRDLTKLLIEKGYLRRDIWENESPNYYLEVKTTLRGCSEQFYMSTGRYTLMQSMPLQPDKATPNIYIVLRVFNLGGNVGIRLYVDPESLRLAKKLDFKTGRNITPVGRRNSHLGR